MAKAIINDFRFSESSQYHHTDDDESWCTKALLLGADVYELPALGISRWGATYVDSAVQHRYFFRATTRNTACRNLVEHLYKERTDDRVSQQDERTVGS
jgi:hypothetical protein